ncbi:hypothetical protein MRB53_040575 [Persea americana]|nr:hypothetical protein MRB53_040575 [Persea americana]
MRSEVDQNQSKKTKQDNAQKNAQPKKKKEPQIEYFGVTIPTTEVLTLLEGTFATQLPEVAQMYNSLKEQKRIQAEFHVTIIHRSMASQHSKQWSQLQELYNKSVSPDDQPLVGEDLAEVNVSLPKLVWNDRIMAFTAETTTPIPALTELCKSANPVAHVTVGTANASIKPVESNDMLMRWDAQPESQPQLHAKESPKGPAKGQPNQPKAQSKKPAKSSAKGPAKSSARERTTHAWTLYYDKSSREETEEVSCLRIQNVVHKLFPSDGLYPMTKDSRSKNLIDAIFMSQLGYHPLLLPRNAMEYGQHHDVFYNVKYPPVLQIVDLHALYVTHFVINPSTNTQLTVRWRRSSIFQNAIV